MDRYTGDIVRSLAGHDKGTLFCVTGQEGDLLLLSDGKRRKVSAPKRKKRGHVDMVCRGTFQHPAIQKLRDGLAVSDRELRRALAVFRDEFATDQGGN